MESLLEAFRRLRDDEPLLFWIGAVLAGLAPVTLALVGLDGTRIQGANRWIKPTKFLASSALYTWTVAFMLGPLQRGARRRFIRWSSGPMLVGEDVLIVLQAARGVPSHFNMSGAFNTTVFVAMGLMILVVTAGAIALLAAYLRDPGPTDLSPVLMRAVQLGLVVSLVGSAVGGTMIALWGSDVGASRGAVDAGLPFLGWSTEHGDLRPAHFVGLHSLQTIPLVGLAVLRNGGPDRPDPRVWPVWAAAAVYAGLTVGLYVQAMAGHPVVGI